MADIPARTELTVTTGPIRGSRPGSKARQDRQAISSWIHSTRARSLPRASLTWMLESGGASAGSLTA